jgi:PAS domain S-box-containing protein
MGDTGAVSRSDRTPADRDRAGFGRAADRAEDVEWVQVGLKVLGPLVTLSIAIAADLLARRGVPVPSPVPLLLVSIVFAALRGGLPSGLVSAFLTVLYGAHYYSAQTQGLAYGTEEALSLAVLIIAAPLVAYLVVERSAYVAAPIGAPPVLAARRALLAEVAARVSLTREVEATLQSVSRTLVPALGDCCLIQLLEPDGTLQCAGSAHIRPQQELLARTLCERGWPDAHWRGRSLETVTLEARELGPGTALMVPLAAGDGLVGRLTLVRNGTRAHTAEEAADALELGTRIGLAVAYARLARERAELEVRGGLLFDANPQPMWIFDVETLGFLDVNEAAVRRYGYSRDELLSMTIMDLHPEREPVAHPRADTDRPGVARARHRRRDGSVLDVELTSHELTFQGRPARLVLAHDVTERARARAALHDSEDQLRRAQRSEALGVLAVGIAHEFNDLLTAVRGYSELLTNDFAAEDPRRRDVEEIRRAASRGSVLTRQLLAFASRGAAAPRPVDPNAAIKELSTLIERLAGAETRLAIVLAPEAGPVWIDPGQLEQVLVNLVLYAREALPVGGELVIETVERRVGDGKRRDVRPGRYVLITVTCSGTYAEGPVPSGSATGLSIAYGIVREAGGVLRVLTQPGQGTMLRVYLPRFEVPTDTAEPDIGGHGKTVLVVEDEEGVRELVRRVLVRHGYHVLEARHGKDALLEADRHPERIDLLLTDVVMPEMSGPALAATLLQRRPDLRVLYMSGYTEEEIVRRGDGGQGLALLQKPFAGEELARAVRTTLEAAPATAPVGSSS